MSRSILAARKVGGGIPANVTPPVLSGTVGIGLSLSIAPGTWTGSPSLTYTLNRDGIAIGGLSNVSEATIEAYALVAADIGPDLDVIESDSVSAIDAFSNVVVWDDVVRAPNTAIWVSDDGRTDVSGAVDVWASTYGGKSCTLTAIGASNRPAVNLTGGVGSRPLITTDGTDDVLMGSITLGAAHTANEFAVTGARVAYGALGDVIIGYYNSAALRYAMRDRTTGLLYLGAGTTTIIAVGAPADPDANNQRWWGRRDLGTTTVEIGHGTVSDNVNTGATVVSYADGGDLVFGADNAGTSASNFAVQGLDFGGLMTSTERAEVRAFLTYMTGIAA